VTRWLSGAHPAVFAAWAILAAFSTYFCMYAFRKPFAAASFADGTGLLGLDLKSLYVISQVCGYCLS
jgi:hypothetical protein